MYELPGSQTGAVYSDVHSSAMCYDEERKSERPKIFVMLLCVVLLLAFIAVLGVLVIGLPGGDESAKGNGGDVRGGGGGDDSSDDSGEAGKIPSPPVFIAIPTAATVTTPTNPQTASSLSPTHPPGNQTSTNPQTASSLSPTHPPGNQTCPAGGYYGKRIGRLRTYANFVRGFVYAASENSIVIEGLNYDGMEPKAVFWAEYDSYTTVVSGDRIPDENGSYDYLKAYRGATVHLKVPKKITAYQSLGIYNEPYHEPLGTVLIPSRYELPKEQSLGKPTARFGNVMATDVVLTDSSSMILSGFRNDGRCPNTYFVAARTKLPQPEELTYLIYNGNKMGKLGIYTNTDLTVKVPAGCHWNQFKWFSVYCLDSLSSLCDIDIDKGDAERLPLHSPESAGRQ